MTGCTSAQDGTASFSRALYFSTRLAQVPSTFVELSVAGTKGSTSLRLTPGHCMHVGGSLKLARDVRVGDLVELASGQLAPISYINHATALGLYPGPLQPTKVCTETLWSP